MSIFFIINEISAAIEMAYSQYQTEVFMCMYMHSIKKCNLMYKREWRLDPFDCIIDGMPDNVFQRLYRVSPGFFSIVYSYLLPFYNNEFVFNQSSVGGRPQISFALRLGAFLFYIGRDTDFFTSSWMFGISESSMFNIVKEMTYLFTQYYSHTIFMPLDIESFSFLAAQWNRFSDLNGILGSIDGSQFTNFYCSFSSFPF